MGHVDALFGKLIVKVLLTFALLLVAVVVGQLAARRVRASQDVRQAVAKLITVAIGGALVYWLVLSRAAVV